MPVLPRCCLRDTIVAREKKEPTKNREGRRRHLHSLKTASSMLMRVPWTSVFLPFHWGILRNSLGIFPGSMAPLRNQSSVRNLGQTFACLLPQSLSQGRGPFKEQQQQQQQHHAGRM
jgi:hypothetical protein